MKKISLKNLSISRKKKNPIKKVFSKIVKFLKNQFNIIKNILKPFIKSKKKIVNILGNIHHKVERNKFLSNQYFTRIVVICFFLGINLQLLPYFLSTTRIKLPDEAMDLLDSAGILNKDDYNFAYIPPNLTGDEPSLNPTTIFEKLNEQRAIREKDNFIYSDKLASVAAELLIEAEKYDFELEDKPFTDEFISALNNAGYNYEHVSQNMVVGPLKEAAVIDAWFSNEDQLTALFDSDFKEVGFATKVIKTKYNETLGVTMQVLGSELAQNPAVQVQQNVQQEKSDPSFPPISNEEVFDALNNYRESHTVSRLHLDDNLCKYAEKRVQDLVRLGSLDNHDGFRVDFEDQYSLPQAIKDFNGKKIAENLAYQNCKNMTTGDGFVAQTGTAIIEWCFDSSTAGHREAQLSRELNHACVRNQDGFFVVIFGQK